MITIRKIFRQSCSYVTMKSYCQHMLG